SQARCSRLRSAGQVSTSIIPAMCHEEGCRRTSKGALGMGSESPHPVFQRSVPRQARVLARLLIRRNSRQAFVAPGTRQLDEGVKACRKPASTAIPLFFYLFLFLFFKARNGQGEIIPSAPTPCTVYEST